MKIATSAWGKEYATIGGELFTEDAPNSPTLLIQNGESALRVAAGEHNTIVFGLTIKKRWDGNKFYYILEVDRECSNLIHKPEVHIVTK